MAPRLSSTARRLGAPHEAQVRRLFDRLIDGTACWWCGLPMFRDRTKNWDYDPDATRVDGKPDTTSGRLEGDHSEARAYSKTSIADQLLHRTCNRQRGDGSKDNQRPALTREWKHPLGDLYMGWPA